MNSRQINKIVSGGQTGVDRAAFDFALENEIEIGGFVPKNRRAEDGRISEKYKNLVETETENPAERTELNVKMADATLILSHGELTGGSRLTKEFAEKYQKPVLHLDFSVLTIAQATERTRQWIAAADYKNLNIAGPRVSEDAKIYEKAKDFFRELLS
ncbi:MAG: putative molybdenum carrier protein [Acidobacteria bacterium]|nr:putative molybdenum carrier protein [Acidobacteriota bacterium]